MQFRAQRRLCYVYEEGFVYDVLLDLEGVQEFECLFSGEFEAFGDDPGMDLLLDESLGLLHEFADEQNVGGGAVACDVVLCGGGAGDHAGGGVLDLHFVEEDAAVLGEFDLSGAADEPEVGDGGTF